MRQLDAFHAAYEAVIDDEPYLPFSESPLPALVALRGTYQITADTKTALEHANLELKQVEQRLQKEEADLRDTNAITQSLERRIHSLQRDKQQKMQKSPSKVVRDMIRDLKKKGNHYDTETGKMIRSLNKFIENHLAPMLAAEELGGPVVGEKLDIDEEDLEAGFSSHGRAKKARQNMTDDKRQRRIDEIWGQDMDDGSNRHAPRDERRAAALEMKELTEQLLNRLVEADNGDGEAYVELKRESAVARFLLRAKVAQLHPRDARRLRLVDFGRDLDT